MHTITVISLGGSIIVPGEIDHHFLQHFTAAITQHLEAHPDQKIILVTGGGAPARLYQQAYRAIEKNPQADLLDWLGIAATHLNGTLIRALFAPLCSDPLVTDPTAPIKFGGQILVAAGWKPGFSSDTDAVYLAKRFKAQIVINLSNTAKVYTADPKLDPLALPLDTITWADFRNMVGDTWTPGKNVPFDPIASKEAQAANLQVICADGRNIENTMAILRKEAYEGTLIG